MGHLGNMKEEYRDLLSRLDAGSVTFPEPEAPAARAAWRELLEIYYTPEDAKLACCIPARPSRLDQIARRTDLPLTALEARLDGMCNKGLVMDLVHPKTGEVRYYLAPPVVGFFEFSMMRTHQDYPKQRLAELLDAYAHQDRTFADEVFGGETVVGRALVREELLGEEDLPEVLDWQRATTIISEARTVGVGICYCRHLAEHLDRACDAPQEICLSLDAGADFMIRRDCARPIERSEALEMLDAARQAKLVQIADNVRKRPAYICNCCGCCCGQLQGINEFDLPAVNPSGFVPQVEDQICRGCSRCSRSCPITAISMVARRVEGKLANELRPVIDLERCIGCGVCAQECRKRALRMVQRSEPAYVPANVVERVARMAIERGRLAQLIYETGAGRSTRFMNNLLQVLTNLPVANRVLASEQVRSRFLRFALGIIKDPTAPGRADAQR